MNVKWVPLSEVLEFSREAIDLTPQHEYERIGIYSWGRGHFFRTPTASADMGKMRYFTFPSQVLMFSNIQAWEGGVALVEEQPSNAVCSSRFYAYAIRASADLNLRFVFEYFRTTAGMQVMREASPGTQVRNRLLSREKIESALIPLPPRAEQDRIAAYLDSVERLSGDPSQHTSTTDLIRRDWGSREVRVGDLVTPVVRSEPIDIDEAYPLYGVKWYGEGIFVREIKIGRDLSASSIRRIHSGDLVYNRLFGWKQSFALADADGWASNEFPTFVIDTTQVLPNVLLSSLLSPSFTEAVNAASTGSTPTSRNRLKERDFLDLTVRIPPIERQSALERAVATAYRATTLRRRRDNLAAALLPAARNAVFAAMQ